MKKMPAGEFKARCLRVMEEVKKYRTPVVIHQERAPGREDRPCRRAAEDIFGCMADTVKVVGDVESPVFPVRAWTVLR